MSEMESVLLDSAFHDLVHFEINIKLYILRRVLSGKFPLSLFTSSELLLEHPASNANHHSSQFYNSLVHLYPFFLTYMHYISWLTSWIVKLRYSVVIGKILSYPILLSLLYLGGEYFILPEVQSKFGFKCRNSKCKEIKQHRRCWERILFQSQ